MILRGDKDKIKHIREPECRWHAGARLQAQKNEIPYDREFVWMTKAWPYRICGF